MAAGDVTLSGTVSDSSDSSSRKKKGAVRSGLSAAGSGLSQMSRDEMDNASQRITPVQYKRGGKVRKTKMRGKKRAKPRE